MFVRFRQNQTRLQASLVETRRAGGKVRHEHIASLGSVGWPPDVGGRIAFWQALHGRMAGLNNRVDAATQRRLMENIHARIPMVTMDEIRNHQKDNASTEANAWDTLAGLHGSSAADQAGLIAKAEHARAGMIAGEREAKAAADQARDRVAKIDAGEQVAGGLGKPLTFADLIEAGFTKAEIDHCLRTNDVAKVYGFEVMSKAILEAIERARINTVRAMYRQIEWDEDDG